MRSVIPMICVFLTLLLFLSACTRKNTETETMDEARAEELLPLAQAFTSYLQSEDYEAALGMMDDTLTASLEGKLESTWLQLIKTRGAFAGTGDYIGVSADGYDAIEITLFFENGTLIQRTVFDRENKLSGLWFKPGKVEGQTWNGAVSDSIEEISVTVDAGDGYPLDGMLTIPRNGTSCAAVVLIHGSGPSDMNAAIGVNAPFRDLAQKLAEKGIAVLRYNKRTYSYGAKMAQSQNIDTLTVDDETVVDAVAAVNLLKSMDRIDAARVYLLGHSMGGGLLSYINSQGADCAGYIIMAGSPRNLWELSAEQNLRIADELEQAGEEEKASELRAAIEQEVLKGEQLAEMSDKDALDESNAVFGMSAWYLRKLAQIDPVALHLSDGKPLLILQGGKDRQVTMTDFELWKDGLEAHPNATFRAYADLNHLFGAYTGEAVPFSALVSVEYAQATPVADEVIEDIAEWLHPADG